MGKYYHRIQKIPVYCSDDYNLAQKFDNSFLIVYWSRSLLLVTHDGGTLSRVGELSLTERLQGRWGTPPPPPSCK